MSTSLQDINFVLELISYTITILGVPVGIHIYLRQKRKERKDQEYITYNALDDKYMEFLTLCMANTDLNVYSVPDGSQSELTPEQKKRQHILFEILICILERAFLMYHGHSDKIRKLQWEGWRTYMKDWMKNGNFREAWQYLGDQYEENFIVYMNDLYGQEVGRSLEVPQSA